MSERGIIRTGIYGMHGIIGIITTGSMEQDITYKVIGCAMTVHSALGNSFQEVIYQRALDIELKKNGIDCVREFDMPIFYDGIQIGSQREDFLINGNLSVELKAIVQLGNVHLAQAMNYLEAYNIEIGLLINFGSVKLQFHQLRNKKFKNNNPHSINSMHSINSSSDSLHA